MEEVVEGLPIQEWPEDPADIDRYYEIPKIEIVIPTDAELLEELETIDNEIRTEVKEKASQPLPKVENEVIDKPAVAETTPAPQPEQVDEPVKVKVEPPLSDGIVCESSTHHFRCTEVTNEKTITNTDTTDTDR